MNLSDFVIGLNGIYPSVKTTGCSIKPLISALNSKPGAPLTKLTLAGLLQPGIFDKCIYLFEEGSIHHMIVTSPPSITPTDYWYIGKCCSLSFPSRIGGHLDIRVSGYMNHLIKYTAWVLSKLDYKFFKALPNTNKQVYYNCAASVVQDLRLKVISFDGISVSNEDIEKLEKCLKSTLHPYLNDPLRGVFKKSTLTIIP